MKYRVAIEDMEPNHWVAWVLDLPGCFSSARTQDDAIDWASLAIAEYFTWLRSYQESLPAMQGPFDVDIVETFRSFAAGGQPRYYVNAFFADDRRVLAYWDVAVALQLLVWTREDLLRVVTSLTREQLDEPVAGDVFGSITGILGHVAGAENWYFGHLDLGLDRPKLPPDPFEMLQVVRANTRAKLIGLVGDDRITTRRDEQWSARKVVRRTLWHERDHTQHIARILARRQRTPGVS